MMRLALASLLMIAALPQPAQAGWVSGDTLLKACSSTTQMQLSACISYIQGVADMSNMSGLNFKYGPIVIPAGKTADDMRTAVVAYLVANPDMRKYVASDAVYIALKLAFDPPAEEE